MYKVVHAEIWNKDNKICLLYFLTSFTNFEQTIKLQLQRVYNIINELLITLFVKIKTAVKKNIFQNFIIKESKEFFVNPY